jgi:ribose-phosphate pyrophosphokinase
MKLFALNTTREFGERVASGLGIALGKHEERDFEDGEHKIRPLENVRNQDVFVIQSLYSDKEQTVNDKLCRLLFFIGALKDASARSVTAVVPYICYARKDRKTKPRDPLTMRYVAQLFEAVGTSHVLTMDVHNLQAFQNAFRCPTDHLEAVKFFTDYLVKEPGTENLVVMSPDIGGIKRAERFQEMINKRLNKSIPLVFMEKYRSSGEVWGETIVGDVKDRTVVIIDDLISTGGTLARCAEACRKAGAQKTWCFTTHGIFTGRPDEILLKDSLQKIIITNTIPPFRLTGTQVKNKVTVLDVAPLFAQAIKCIDEGGSVTDLLI